MSDEMPKQMPLGIFTFERGAEYRAHLAEGTILLFDKSDHLLGGVTAWLEQAGLSEACRVITGKDTRAGQLIIVPFPKK